MRPLWLTAPALSFALGILAPLTSAAQDDPPRPAAAAVTEQFSYFVRDHGLWTQRNEDHAEGEPTPVVWVKRMSFEMAGNVMVDRTYAVFENDVCRPMIMIVQSAELDTGKFRSTAFAENGIQFSGTISVIDDETSELIAEGKVNSEITLRLREVTDTSDPDEYVANAFDPDGEGGWTYRDSRSWAFDASLDVCR